MGTDIHAIIEIKNSSGNWVAVPEIPKAFVLRNYFIFDVLRYICKDGLPDEAKGKRYRYCEDYDFWEVDFSEGVERRYFDFGWATLKDFQDYTFKHNPYYVSVAFYDRFIELGGKFPEAMFEEYTNGNKITFSVLDEEESEELDCLLDAEKEFSRIAELYNVYSKPENIRVIFAFDC